SSSRILGSRTARDAEACRDALTPGVGRDADPGNSLEDHRRDEARILRMAVAHDDRELVAADPGGRIAAADDLAQDRADASQQLVTDGMPGGVVHHLEVVEVDEQD